MQLQVVRIVVEKLVFHFFGTTVGCLAQLAECPSLAGELTLSCTWPVADG